MTMTDTPLFTGLDVPAILPIDDTARARRSDPITSHLAADSTVKNKADSRMLVYLLLMENGPLANFEVERLAASKGSDFTGSRLRTARKELSADGLIEFAGYYRLTPTKRRAEVWQIRKVSA